MPARVSTRTSTSTRVSRKSAATTSSRTSAAEAPDDGPDNALRETICDIFYSAQKTTAGHRKLVVNLRKVQEACCYENPEGHTGKGSNRWDGFEEDDFNAEVARCVLRVVPVKKTESAGDRIVRFLGQFLQSSSEKDLAMIPEEELNEATVFPETASSRLVSHILSMLLPLFTAKEKTVRFRSTQIVSHIVNALDSLDDECFQLLRAALLKRLRDKEPMVRVQAILGLARLAGDGGDEQDEDSDEEDAMGLLERLLEVLQNDPSSDVRRSLLLNLPLTPATLPYLLERARDQDAATRRALYSRLLPSLGDFRHLSLSMREKLLRWGLRDRDENVRKATARLFRERWIEDCAGGRDAEGHPAKEVMPANLDALLELLERVDVVNSGIEDGISHEAMREFWDGRPDYIRIITFENSYWDDLTSERVFLARSLNDYCRMEENEARFGELVEEKMPEVTKLAFFIQRYANKLVTLLQDVDPETGAVKNEEEAVELEFVVEQLLHIALTLDYSDEVGRRKMFALLREGLAMPELPEEITKLTVEALRLICGFSDCAAAEREFCGVVLEAVAEVHDTIAPPIDENSMAEDPDESFHSAKSELTDTTPTKAKGTGPKTLLVESAEVDEEKAIREILVNMKCLHIAQCMLQNVGENLKDNVHLVTMLNNLVVPAVRSHEAPIRERGLLALGLCCLLDKNLAEENISLFLHCFNKGHAALQSTALQTLCDILLTHPSILTTPPTNPAATPSASNSLPKQLLKAFHKGLKAFDEPDVQASATTSLCKLLLARLIPTTPSPSNPASSDAVETVRQLCTTFFDPASAPNAATRQALSYFLPAFGRSRPDNAELVARATPQVVHAAVGRSEELHDDENEEMVGLAAVGSMLVDWTDPRRCVVRDGEATGGWDEVGKREKEVRGDVHLILAEGLLERGLSHGCSKEEKKALISMLGKVFVSSNSPPEKLQAVADLVDEAIDAKLLSDAASRNALTKLQGSLAKALGELREKESTPAATSASGRPGSAGLKSSTGRKSVAVAFADGEVPGTLEEGEGEEAVAMAESVEEPAAVKAEPEAEPEPEPEPEPVPKARRNIIASAPALPPPVEEEDVVMPDAAAVPESPSPKRVTRRSGRRAAPAPATRRSTRRTRTSDESAMDEMLDDDDVI